ncbi:MAG: DUF4340 domain-containing protein [Clostridia bacterium]|nr:DUF4340 domain-containing protein [Clostridia bacterium]
MSVKGIIIKIVLGLLMVAILAGSIYQLLKPTDDGGNEAIVVYTADPESVEKVQIKGAEEFTLIKKGSEWTMEGVEGVKVDKTFADTLVKSLCNIQSPMKADGVKAAECGLEEGAVTVTLDFGSKTKTISIGSESGEYRYLKMQDDRDIYLVLQPDLYMVFLEKIKYLDNTVLQMYEDKVKMLEYNDVTLEKTESGWVEKTPYDKPADEAKIKSILEEMSDISAIEIVPKDEVAEAEAKPVAVTLNDGTKLVFDVIGDCIIYENTDYAYRVAENELAFLNTTGFDFIGKYVAPIAITEVSGVKMVSNEGIVEFKIEAPDSEAPVFYKNGAEVSAVLFRDFYQKLMGLTFTREGSVEGVVEYSITFTKTDGTTCAVQFLPISESEYAVDVNGEKGFVVNKKSVKDIFEAAKNLKQ